MTILINRLFRLTIHGLLSCGLFATVGAQASVIYTSRTSTVNVPGETQSSTDLNPFSASLIYGPVSGPFGQYGYATAQQDSQISGNTISVLVAAHGEGGTGSSSFQLNFDLTTPTVFTLSGSYALIGNATSTVSLSGPTTLDPNDISCFDVYDCSYSNAGPSQNKILAAGIYSLVVSDYASTPNEPYADVTTDIKLSLTPVPVPESVTLLSSALGLLGLLTRRKGLVGSDWIPCTCTLMSRELPN